MQSKFATKEYPAIQYQAEQYTVFCNGCYSKFIITKENMEYIMRNNMDYCSCPMCRQYVPVLLKRKLRDKQMHLIWINGIGEVQNPQELSEYLEIKAERDRKKWEKENTPID